jgi:hypothetical protein
LNTVTNTIYSKTVSNSHGKNESGKAARPMDAPKLVKGMIVRAAIPVKVSTVSGKDARLCMKGIFGVRIIWITSVCVHIDSTNQPAWKTAINNAIMVGSVI